MKKDMAIFEFGSYRRDLKGIEAMEEFPLFFGKLFPKNPQIEVSRLLRIFIEEASDKGDPPLEQLVITYLYAFLPNQGNEAPLTFFDKGLTWRVLERNNRIINDNSNSARRARRDG